MGIESILNEHRIFHPAQAFVDRANVSGMAAYEKLCAAANENYEKFWADLARELIIWKKPFTTTLNGSDAPFYKWFEDGELNVSYNCLDKHLNTQPNKIAIIFEADNGEVSQITYKELYEQVCQFANGLKTFNLNIGDRVVIYLPMGIEAVVSMLACSRIGLTHSVVFGGFSAKSIQERIKDAKAKLVITSDIQYRGGKTLPLKATVDEALNLGSCESIINAVILKKSKDTIALKSKETWWHDLIKNQSTDCDPVYVNAEHPLFLLYTSGSTGTPKGVQHSSAGYLLHAMNTMRWTFDIKDDDVYWCTADVGWITGHTYVVYGPLAMGATQLIYEGIPTYPHAGRFWQMIEKHHVSIFYTAPTAIRSLIKASELNQESNPDAYDLSSLRLLGSVGEPINPEAWMWYYRTIGDSRCPIVDTWWQTETGGIMIAPQTGAHPLKPGSATKPFYGIKPALLDKEGKEPELYNINRYLKKYADKIWDTYVFVMSR